MPHDRLLKKLLELLPPWLVRWIAAYLKGRIQNVKVGDLTTEWKNVEAEVVQGSVLGPVLFISDINNYLTTDANTKKYADDIISYIIGKATTTTLPQRVVDAVQLWCDDNLMRLNAGKCKFIHFP